ncbi:MAG: DUF7344 domain-containing protein [Halobacteriota archaeon]
MASPPGSLDKDDVFEILSNARRRRLLFLLYGRDEPAELGDLAQDIATTEAGGEADRNQYKRMYISLYQTHVPKLEEYGVIEYDPETKLVELTDRVDDVIAVFQAPARRPPWWRYYALVGLVSAVVVIGLWWRSPGDDSVELGISLIPVALLFAIVAYHYYRSTETADVLIERMVS